MKLGAPKRTLAVAGSSTKTSKAAPPTWPSSRRLAQRLLVDQAAAGAIDDHHPRPGLRQGLGREDVAGLVGQRGVQADDVGAGQKLVQLDLLHPDLHRPLGREEGIVGDDLHLQAIGPVGDDRADVAGADQAQGLGVELDAHEAVLLPPAGLGGVIGGRQLPGQGEHHGDGVLGGGDRVAERRVHHHDRRRRWRRGCRRCRRRCRPGR